MNQLSSILLLVLVLESSGKFVVNDSRASTNLTLNDGSLDVESIERLSTEATIVARTDSQDPIESSEPVVKNRFKKSFEHEEEDSEEDEDPEGPPDHSIPYSEHEEARDVPTKPKYPGPGQWAKPSKDDPEFVPTKLIAQVRRTHTVRRLPRRKAIEHAESDEEKENAARLREVVKNSKVNTVYTEEGYEDSAYDHAGHIRDADFEEEYDRKLDEHLGSRKKSGDDDDEGEDYDEYHRDDTNTVTGKRDWEDYAKDVAEKGAKKLQDDVEEEVGEIEKRFDVSKLENDESSTDNKEQRKKIKKQRRPVSIKKSRDDNEERVLTTMIPTDEIVTDGRVETTTLRNKLDKFVNPTGLYQYDQNSPYINYQRANENPTTVSYSQLFWDYFKARQNGPTTQISLETTTISPNILHASSLIGNINTVAPYSFYGEETTTSFPMIDPSVFGAQNIAPTQIVVNPEIPKNNEQYNKQHSSKENNVDEFWQATTTVPQFIDKISTDDQGIQFSNLVKNLDSTEETNTNFGGSLFNPSLSSLTSRKPRYKIAVRQKPTKESSTSKPVETISTTLPFNENYMKVLMHLKNEENAKKSRYPSNSFYRSNINDPEYLTRMRPPVPQRTSDYFYHDYLARENQRKARTYRGPQTYPEAYSIQRSPSKREKDLMFTIDRGLAASSLRNDIARTRETVDYLITTGNVSNQARNLRPFRRSDQNAGIRARRRGKRSTDEGGGGNIGVKGSVANKDASNRGEIERAVKSPRIERNSRVIEGRQVGLVPDTSSTGEKRNYEKKSRSNGNDRGIGSSLEGRAVERESHGTTQDDLKSSKYNEDEWKSGRSVDDERAAANARLNEGKNVELAVIVESREKRSALNAESTKEHEVLLNESPRVTNDIIEKELEARFNKKEDEEDGEEDTRDNVEVEVPDFDYVEEFTEENRVENETTEATVNARKYPFYNNENIPVPSALKYAIDPRRLPKKTYGGMEFYGLRDNYKHCEDVEPTLKVLPEKEEPQARGPEENVPRLQGLGDKLDCYKAKYFDSDPFDNPLFLEKEVADPSPLSEVDTKQFASRIMMFPKQDDDYVVQKSSRKPENYHQHRKQNSNSVRPQQSRRIRYRVASGTGRGKRPVVYRTHGSRMKHVNDSRRPQKNKKRPIGSASSVSTLYTPYQSQVYEDVMGTIRNLANSYQVHEVTTEPSSEEVTVASEKIEDVKVNVSVNSTNYSKRDNDKVSITIVDSNNKADTDIEGMRPPRYHGRRQSNYKRNRPPQKGKSRMQYSRKPSNGLRINRVQKIRIYKRDLRDSSEEISTIELNSMEKKTDEGLSNSEESNEQVSDDNLNKTAMINSEVDYPVRRNLTTVTLRRNFKVAQNAPANTSIDNEKKEKDQKVVYTIRDRIRYSKPKEEIRKVGKFVNETEVREDHRRREPLYNIIRRRRPLNSTTVETSSNSTEKVNGTESSVLSGTTINKNVNQTNRELTTKDQETHSAIEADKNQYLNASKIPDRDQLSHSNDQTANQTGNGYAVHEKVDESGGTTTGKPPPATSAEHFNMNKFLESDLPGYSELNSSEFKKALFSNDSKPDDPKFDVEATSAKETENEKQSKEENVSKPSRSNEESSEKMETSPKYRTSTESSEESNSKESEEDRSFFRYDSRPSSPAENYEDEKYAELGPRVNKPSFFHPPFSFSSYKKPKDSSEEIEDSDEKEYVFPWYRDKENARKKRRYRGKFKGDYEYPWERRERLAREEKRMKHKKLSKGFDSDEDAEESLLKHRSVYPRGRHRFWSRVDKEVSDEIDNAESNSDVQPILKYSSRYSLKNAKLNKKPLNVEEISRSIKEALEKDSKEKNASIKGRGIVPEHVTLEPMRRSKEKGKNSTSELTNGEKNVTELIRNVLRDSTTKTPIMKSSNKETVNSTSRANKKRRRPAKNSISVAETTLKSVDESNRSRRRQKSGSTTPATTTSTVSTTLASRVVRRRNQKSVKDSSKNATSKAASRSNNGIGNGTESRVTKNRALGHRSNTVKGRNDEKKSPVNEIHDQSKENSKRQEKLVEKSKDIKRLDTSEREILKGRKDDKKEPVNQVHDQSKENSKREEKLVEKSKDIKRLDTSEREILKGRKDDKKDPVNQVHDQSKENSKREELVEKSKEIKRLDTRESDILKGREVDKKNPVNQVHDQSKENSKREEKLVEKSKEIKRLDTRESDILKGREVDKKNPVNEVHDQSKENSKREEKLVEKLDIKRFGTSESDILKGRNDQRKDPINEIRDQSKENSKHEEKLMEKSKDMKRLDTSKSDHNTVEIENVNTKLDDLEKIEEMIKFEDRFPSIDSDEGFEFKDDRIETLDDFDRPIDTSSGDYDEKFGTVVKTEVSFSPDNRAVQLSEQGSREVVSSVSWISENYNF